MEIIYDSMVANLDVLWLYVGVIVGNTIASRVRPSLWHKFLAHVCDD